VGIEGTYDWTNLSGSSVESGGQPNPPNIVDVDVHNIGMLNGRIGVANGRWLAFATGGWAAADAEASESRSGQYFDSGSERHNGWDAGAGLQ
jgi:opacity protein-like surface antigen